MAFCMNCGKQLPDGAKFCLECGTKLGDIKEDQTPKRETTYEGTIHKCPNCGDILDAYESVCESCGYERRGTKATSSVQELSRRLQELEAQRPQKKDTSVFKQMLEQGRLSKIDEQKIDLIKNFAIPNTKEDLFEFLILSSSNMDTERVEGMDAVTLPEKALSDAWRTKYEQAYHKAKLCFGNAPELKEFVALHATKIERHQQKKRLYAVGIGLLFVLVVIMLIFEGAFIFAMDTKTEEKIAAENTRLEQILTEINECIKNEDYDLARTKTAQLVFTVTGGLASVSDAKENWDEIREEIYIVIEQAEKSG